MLKATRFMRRPIFVFGYKVDAENMEQLARWCEGHVIRDAERPFVRVPVNRPTHINQTKAYEGTWILLFKNLFGTKSFKVYDEEWLDKNFIRMQSTDDGYVESDFINEPDPKNNNRRPTAVPKPPRVKPAPLNTPFRVVENQ